MSKSNYIFISHSSEDRILAKTLCHFLEDKGLLCWITPRDISPGKDYAQAIIEAIHSCSVMILIFTKFANESNHVKNEVERAFSTHLIIIPFRVENIVPAFSLEYFLSSTHWLDAYQGKPEDYFKEVYKICSLLIDNKAETEFIIKSSEKNANENTAKKTKSKGIHMVIATTVIIIALVLFFTLSKSHNPSNSQIYTDTASISKNVRLQKQSSIPGDTIKKNELKSIPKKTIKFGNIKAGIKSNPAESKATDIPEDLNNTVFEDVESTNTLTFFVINKITARFQGRACSYDIFGKAKLHGNIFEVISGNVTGVFSMGDNYNRITGSVIIKESGLSCSTNLKRQ